VGPEGSALMIPLNLLLFIALYYALPKRKQSAPVAAGSAAPAGALNLAVMNPAP
jgi:hypothetical protein